LRAEIREQLELSLQEQHLEVARKLDDQRTIGATLPSIPALEWDSGLLESDA
jgi:hypothetical protein